MQRQTAVTAYFSSKQLPLFVFALITGYFISKQLPPYAFARHGSCDWRGWGGGDLPRIRADDWAGGLQIGLIPQVVGPAWATTTPLCKAKRQYLLTCKVSRYCLLALHCCDRDPRYSLIGLHAQGPVTGGSFTDKPCPILLQPLVCCVRTWSITRLIMKHLGVACSLRASWRMECLWVVYV